MKTKTRTIEITLEGEERDLVFKLAKDRGMTLGQYFQACLDELIEEMKDESNRKLD